MNLKFSSLSPPPPSPRAHSRNDARKPTALLLLRRRRLTSSNIEEAVGRKRHSINNHQNRAFALVRAYKCYNIINWRRKCATPCPHVHARAARIMCFVGDAHAGTSRRRRRCLCACTSTSSSSSSSANQPETIIVSVNWFRRRSHSHLLNRYSKHAIIVIDIVIMRW